jgi:hypothetical protein
MEVTAVLSAQAIRPVVTAPAVYIPDVVEALKDRYGFVVVPHTPEQVLNRESLTFGHGKFVHEQRTMLIVSLKIFAQAFLVETGTSTEDSDLVIDDLLKWLPTSGLSVTVHELGTGRIYMSHLEVALSVPLEHWFPMTAKIGEMIADSFRRQGRSQEVPPFQVYFLGMNVDPTNVPHPCDFRIERRLNVPYVENKYFAQAPLTTAEHITILRAVEEAVLSTKP